MPVGYRLLDAGYYRLTDGAGPYAWDGVDFELIGSGRGEVPVAPPVNTVAPTIAGTPVVGQTLVCARGTWTNSPTSYGYVWYWNSDPVDNAITYTLVDLDVGGMMTCRVSATNALGTSGFTTSNALGPVTAALAAPVNTVVPVITGTAMVGQTLTASTGTWTGNPTPTYAYAWKNAGVAIGGATASTYALQASDEGDLITVTVTATNSQGNASATSASVGPIAAALAEGGAALLTGETDGFATDFVGAIDAQRVAKKVASTVTEYGLDGFYTNTSTSPKQVWDVSGVLGWSPHNMFLNSAAPVTQNVTTVVGQNYTVTVTGAGTMTGSAGASGVATGGSPLTYTATTTTSTFTKAGTVTQIQMNRGAVATAYIATTAAIKNGLAVDYDPVTHAILGVLNEPAGTNYIFPSSPVGGGGSNWTIRGGTTTLTPGQIGPTGAATAALAHDITTLANGDFYKFATGLGASVRCEPSFFLKKVTATGVLRCQDAYTGTANGSWDINLAALGSGWERITRSHAAVTINAEFQSDSGGNGGLMFLNPPGTVIDFYIDLVQLHVGTVATSPIPTFAATATRAADQFTITSASIPYSATAGSWWLEIYPLTIIPANARVIYNISGSMLTITQTNVVMLTDSTSINKTTSVLINNTHKISCAFASGDRAITADGLTPTTDAGQVTNLLAPGATIYFGGVPAANITHGYYRKLYYLPRRMPNAEMVTETT